MKIPSKVVIKGKVWQIAYKWRLHDEDLGKCDGLTIWEEKTIYIDRALPREDKEKVVIGEILHILIDEYQLRQTGGVNSDHAAEVICHGIGESLLEIFKLTFRAEHHNVVARTRGK